MPCGSTMVSGQAGLLHPLNWLPWKNWNTFKSEVKLQHYKPHYNSLLSKRFQ